MSTDPVTLLGRALDQTEAIIAGIGEDQHRLPTPCRSWDVGELLAHLVYDLGAFTERADGGTPSWSDPIAVVEGSYVEAYRRGSAGLVGAWSAAGDLTGTMEMSGMGEVAKRFPIDQQIAELAVHGWDLAVATGQPTELDPEIGDTAITWARATLAPAYRGTEADGKVFGPEVEVPQNAPLYDRLAGFFGHRHNER